MAKAELKKADKKRSGTQRARRVIKPDLTGDEPADLRLSRTIDTTARHDLEEHIFGKRVLATNRDCWPIGDVVAAYRSQSDAEFGFRQLKDPHVVSFSPMHHWTDQAIRVHILGSTHPKAQVRKRFPP